MPRPSPRTALLLIALCAPLLRGEKCISRDSDLDAQLPVPDAVGGWGEQEFSDGEPCSEEGVALFHVQDYAYEIICGCKEGPPSKTCTVPVGTQVIWKFTDSVEHNVLSLGDTFGQSPDMLGGTWNMVVRAPGTLEYKCSIHNTEMREYFIVVE